MKTQCLAVSYVLVVLAVLLVFFSCSSSSETTDAGPGADTGPGADAGTAPPDAGTPADAGADAGAPDSGADAGTAYAAWDETNRWKPAAMPACPNPRNPTSKDLAGKAAYYDWLASKIHLVPETVRPFSLAHNVTLAGDVPTEIVPDAQIPAVATYHYAENHGLWSSLFVASQAFRYAATKSPESLSVLRRAFGGTYRAMKITGIPGLFTREYRDNTIPGNECPAEGEEYAKPVERKGNRWVKLDENACTWYWDPDANGGAGAMVKDDPAHCVDPMYANMCWQRNCSKDESAGHNFAAAIIYRIVDDPEIKAMAAEVLGGLAGHLVKNAYRLVDYDGIPTRYGSHYAMSLDELPGFNALGALAATRSGLTATQDDEIRDAYFNCLLQMKGARKCINQPTEYDAPYDYAAYMEDDLGINFACTMNNYDNVNMALLNFMTLVAHEGDPSLRARFRAAFHRHSKGPNASGQSLWDELNPHWNFVLVGLLEKDDAKTMGVTMDEARATKMIDEGICTLKDFPETNVQRAADSTGYPETCVSQRHGSLTDKPVPIEERCTSLFEWWGSPYERQTCGADPKQADIPTSYLLPYWAGRHFGFINEDM
ncbi:MAG: hypothetical protein HY897_15090 [Deltaproteobacteria bacterium]|nr:hypothetical protein [Deltaproteobacteria bacterium]